MRFLILSLLLLSQNSVFAYSSEHLIDFYQNYYKEEMGIGFFKKKYYIKDAKLRKEILGFVRKNGLETSDELIEKEWDNFIKTRFENIDKLEQIAQDNYHELEDIKAKFIEDRDLLNYFGFLIIPRLQKDLKLRDKLLTGVITAKITDKDRLEAQSQFFNNLKVKDISELEMKYGLDQEDLDYLITTTVLIKKRSDSVL